MTVSDGPTSSSTADADKEQLLTILFDALDTADALALPLVAAYINQALVALGTEGKPMPGSFAA